MSGSSWHLPSIIGSEARSLRAGEHHFSPFIFFLSLKEPVQRHFFSKHDNRTSFDKGPYCLLQGIGRRKDLDRLWQRHTFLRWAPCELELSQQRPLESSYQANFQSGPGVSDFPQRLVHFVQIQPPRTSTTYQQNFCQPSRGGYCGNNMGSVTDTLPDLPGIPRPKLLQHYLHAGVSECLNWSRALNKDE
uniref:Ciliary microtubule inner protein 7 n=1 Tax=Canis lupus dingo TaxID=286419 RepID=A0A8C0L8H0_CANLU